MSVAETNFPRVTSPSLQGGGVMDTAPAPTPAPAPTNPATGLPQQTAGQAYNEKMTNRGIDAVIRANPDYLKPKVKSHRGRVKKGATEAAAKKQREAIQKVLTEDLGKAPVRSDFDNYSTGPFAQRMYPCRRNSPAIKRRRCPGNRYFYGMDYGSPNNGCCTHRYFYTSASHGNIYACIHSNPHLFANPIYRLKTYNN